MRPDPASGQTLLTSPAQPSPQTAQAVRAQEPTYGELLKSATLIGGSSALSVVFGIFRAKAIALLIGKTGIGMLSLYGSLLDFTLSIVGMGVNSSGVRQIAEAAGSNETLRIARTTIVLRRISFLLGVLGALLFAALSRPVSTWTFGSDKYAGFVVLLSAAVLFQTISDGQRALIQGMRRILDLAMLSLLGALYSAVIWIALVYSLGENGVVPSLVGVSLMTFMASWWFSRKLQIPTPAMTASQTWQEAAALLKLGLVFMAVGMLSMGASWVIRIIIHKSADDEVAGLAATGLYQAAWALGGQYVNFILQAMGSDFYPRLTAVAKDDSECNRLVNEQAKIGLLLAGPGVLATLTLAPLVLKLFYSADFIGAAEALRWICLAMVLRVTTWSMAFIVLAKGAVRLFFWTELITTVAYVGLALLLIRFFGVTGGGMAYFGLYVVHGIVSYLIVRRLSGFRWSSANGWICLLLLSLIGLVFGSFYVLPFRIATTAGMLAAILSGVYSMGALIRLFPLNRMPRFLHRLLVRLRVASEDAF